MKKLLNIVGAQKLDNHELKSIIGGVNCITNIAGQCVTACSTNNDCTQCHYCTGGGYCQPGICR